MKAQAICMGALSLAQGFQQPTLYTGTLQGKEAERKPHPVGDLSSEKVWGNKVML